jgi:hypothetical protein
VRHHRNRKPKGADIGAVLGLTSSEIADRIAGIVAALAAPAPARSAA